MLWFDPADSDPAEGDHVVVETERGREYGEVVEAPHDVSKQDLPAPLKPVVRVATADDRRHASELDAREHEALPIYRELVKEHKLDMKPVSVEYLFGGDKIVFYFSAEERVDFRDLVREVAHRHAADRRARRSSPRGRRGALRAAAVLRAFWRGIPACFDPHGQRAGPAPEPLEDKRSMRQTHVLSPLRVRRVQGLQDARTKAGSDR
jgi:hypothetical protein